MLITEVIIKRGHDWRLSLHRIYYDKALTRHSPDAADRFVTERVITIMLAEEY